MQSKGVLLTDGSEKGKNVSCQQLLPEFTAVLTLLVLAELAAAKLIYTLALLQW